MSLLGDLLIRLRAETADFQQDMGKAAAMAESSMKQVERAAAKLGATLSAGGFVLLAKHSIDAADHLFQLNKTTSIAVEELAGLSVAAKQSGADLDSVAVSVNKLSVNIGKTPEKFKALGVSAKDPLEAFKQLADVFVSIEDPQLRAAVAAAALGKSWATTAPLLAMGGEKIGEMVEKGAKASGVTKELTEQANQFNEKLVLLTGTGGLMTRMIGPALPLLNQLADDMLRAQEGAQGLNSGLSPLLELLKVFVILGSDVSFVFTTMGKDIARAAENVQLIAKGDFAGSRALGEAFKNDAKAAREALDAWQATIAALGKPGPKIMEDNVGAGGRGTGDAAARAFIGSTDAEFKRYVSALKTLEMQLATLNGMTAQQRMQMELYGTNMTTVDGKTIHLEGSLEKLTGAHKGNLLEVARLIDARKRLLDLSEASTKMLTEEEVANKRRNESVSSQLVTNHQQLDDMAFELSLMGKTTREVEMANAARKIELDLRRQIGSLPKLEEGATPQQIAENARAEATLRQRAEEQTRLVKESIGTRIDAEREWLAGAQRAFLDYADYALNAAQQAKEFFSNSFRNMEDALIAFSRTGKLNFTSLADSIINDLIRMQLRAQVTGPLAAAMAPGGGGILSALGLGGGGSTGGSFGADLASGIIPMATGGRANAGQPYWVGDGGEPELFVPDSSGSIVPASQMGGGGIVINADLRGASVEAVARLEAYARRIDATLERRAVAANNDYRRRV